MPDVSSILRMGRLSPMRSASCLLLTSSLFLIASFADAEVEHEVGGNAKFSLTEIDAGRDLSIEGFNFRLNSESRLEELKLSTSLQALSIGINSIVPEGARAEDLLMDDDLRLLRLDLNGSNSEKFATSARLDRFALAYENGDLNFSLGRQALSIGKGILFQSLDIFNPFSPVAIDKEYKPGEDMALMRYQLWTDFELQGFAIARRDAVSKDVDSEASSFAVRTLGRFRGGDMEALVAKHYDRAFYGGGVAKDLGGSTLRGEASFREDDDGGFNFTGDVNVDRAAEIFERNLYFFMEFFHSGVGSESGNLFELNPQRDVLMARGELYTLGRNYGALGFRYEITPLITLSLNGLHSFEDSSDLTQAISDFNLSDNLRLKLGAVIPMGGRDEFSSGRLGSSGIAQGRQYFCWVEYYF